MPDRTPPYYSPRVERIFSCPDLFARLAAATGAALVSWRQSGVSAGLRDVNTKLQEILNVEDFASSSDPDDTARIQRATAALASRGGGTLSFKHGKSYRIWTTQTDTLMSFSGTRGVRILGNGATITSQQVNYVGANVPQLITLSAVNGFAVEDLKFVGSNSTLTAATGEIFVLAFGGSSNISIIGCEVSNTRSGLYTTYSASTLNSNIRVQMKCTAVYYPLNPGGAANVDAQITTINCGRSYFPVAPGHNHNVSVNSEHGGPFSDCLIKVYAYSTFTAPENTLAGINLNYTTKGRYAGAQSALEGAVNLEFQQGDASTAAGYMRDIRINFDVDYSTSSAKKPANLLIMRRYNFATNPDGTNRAHNVKGLTISGTAIGCDQLTEGGIILCSKMGGSAVWTGDVVSNVALDNLNLAGIPATDSVYVNGEGATSTGPFVLLDNVFVDGPITYQNITAASVSQRNAKSSNVSVVERKKTAFTCTWASSGTQPAIGNGTITAFYAVADGYCDVQITIIPGGTTTFGTGTYSFSLPFAHPSDGAGSCGSALALNSGTGYQAGSSQIGSGGSTISVAFAAAAGLWQTTVPWTFKNGDNAVIKIRYPLV